MLSAADTTVQAALETLDDAAAQKYTDTFNATTDWVLNGSDYELTILGATHGVGNYPIVNVLNSIGDLTGVVINVDTATGNIVVKVGGTPEDLRFAGTIIII